MATKLYLTTQGSSYTYQNYNLLSGTLALVEGSRKVTISGDRAIETMELISARATTDSAIIIAENKLNELGEMARQYIQDNTIMYPVWYQENATSETMRQSLVYDIQLMQKEVAHTSKLLGRAGVSIWTLYIERAAWWEPETVISQTGVGAAKSSCGGTAFFEVGSAYNAGVIDGRMVATVLVPSNSNANEFWIGLRKPREKTDISYYSPLQSVWSCTAGTNGTDTSGTTESTNAYRSDGAIKTCTFTSTPTMATRLTINWHDVYVLDSGVFYPGKYLVLLRAKVGSSTECRVRMSSGYGAHLRVHNDVDISNTSYKLIPIGEVTLPSAGYRSASSAFAMESNTYAINDIVISAERLSGTGYLYLDVLVMIPSDALLYAKVTGMTSNDRVIAYTFPDGEQRVIHSASPIAMEDLAESQLTNWRMPYMGPTEEECQVLAVMAFQTATVQTAADTMDYQIVYLPRYKSFSRYA